MVHIPQGFQRLYSSERLHSSSATFLGPAKADEEVVITIVLRRRPDGLAPPGPEYFVRTPLAQRQRIPREKFALRYGASPTDISQVTEFAVNYDLKVIDINAASRTVRVVGTVAQMEKAFAVELGRYLFHKNGETSQSESEIYRGQSSHIHIPKDLAEIIIGVFGLDNRCISKRKSYPEPGYSDNCSDTGSGSSSSSKDSVSTSDPQNTAYTTVPQITKLYNFPTNSAEGQTIAILSHRGYRVSDIDDYFNDLGLTSPTITDVGIDGATNSGEADKETTMDICVAASAAPGASIAVYFACCSKDWVDMISKIANPQDGDPVCSVLSSSLYTMCSDDVDPDSDDGKTIQAISMAFLDAALQCVTICVASGDDGARSKEHDGKVHVQYPASDPWVLSVGGTSVGNIQDGSFEEYVWNEKNGGATGGGISAFFPLPWYQRSTAIQSLNDGHYGRGVPDVAANASRHSCYKIYVNGTALHGRGTSAAAPLWAGLIAVINASLQSNVGFINPLLYAIGPIACRDIYGPPGPKDNGRGDVTGYDSVKNGWDPCTGWGSIDGQALLYSIKVIVYLFHFSPFIWP